MRLRRVSRIIDPTRTDATRLGTALLLAGTIALSGQVLAQDTTADTATSTETTQTAESSDTTDDTAQTTETQSEDTATAEDTASDEMDAKMKLAEDGDRDAAYDLAKHNLELDEPDHDKAAHYAAIALNDGGEDWAAKFVSDTGDWPKDFWKALQVKLKESGDYRGAIDGLPGYGTQLAVRTYAGIKAAVVKTNTRKKKTYYRKKQRRGSYHN